MPTSINWPISQITPQTDNFKETFGDQVLRSSVDVGPAKLRRRTNVNPDILQMTFMLSLVDASSIETFYKVTTYGGSLSFNFTHPRKLAAIVCRFVGPPIINPTQGGTDATVTMTLEIIQ